MGRYDPVELGPLAEALRDGVWLDIRVVPGGVIARARIDAIVIRREYEQVEICQQWEEPLPEWSEGRPLVRSQNYTLHTEQVWNMAPTEIDREDVKPWQPPLENQEPVRAGAEVKPVIDAVTKAAAELHGVSEEALRNCDHLAHAGVRHYMILALYEMTDLERGVLAQTIGYKSPMAMQSAWWKIKGQEKEAHIRATRKLVERAQEIGGQAWRRTTFEKDYPSLLV